MIDQTLGPYTLTKELGKGGFATVYRALQTALNRYVAIKVLHPEFTRDERAVKRFQREALAVARLSHPNIVGVYDYGEHEGRAYMVMEYIAGNTLKGRLGKPVPYDFALDLVRSVGSALDYAHSKGIIHRDIKPANILFTEDDRIVLSDFGIVRLADNDQSLTRGVIGTPQYMSPEQALGREVQGTSDLYSLGVVLYEMLAGRVPYKGESAIATLSMHATLPVPSVRDLNPTVSREIDDVVQRALAKQPEDRYQTGAALASALADAISGGDRSIAATLLVSTHPGDTASVSQGVTTPPPMDLDSLYQQLLNLTRARDWRGAVSLAAQILARDANYRDVSAILSSASNELRFGRGSTSVQLEFQNMMAEVDIAIQGGRLMEAAALLQQLLRTSPSEASARSKLEQVNRMMGDVETQRRRLARLDQLYQLAQTKIAADDTRWALHILEEVAAMDRNYRDVSELIEQVKSTIDPQDHTIAPATQVTSLREVAEMAMAQNRWADAVSAYEEVIKLEPNLAGIRERLETARHQANVTSMNAEVARLAAEGNLEEAIKKLEEIKNLTRT